MAAQQVGVAHHRGVLGLAAVVPVPARMTNRKYLAVDPHLAWSMGEAESRRLAPLSRKHQKAVRVIGGDQQIVILVGFPARSCQGGHAKKHPGVVPALLTRNRLTLRSREPADLGHAVERDALAARP